MPDTLSEVETDTDPVWLALPELEAEPDAGADVGELELTEPLSEVDCDGNKLVSKLNEVGMLIEVDMPILVGAEDALGVSEALAEPEVEADDDTEDGEPSLAELLVESEVGAELDALALLASLAEVATDCDVEGGSEDGALALPVLLAESDDCEEKDGPIEMLIPIPVALEMLVGRIGFVADAVALTLLESVGVALPLSLSLADDEADADVPLGDEADADADELAASLDDADDELEALAEMESEDAALLLAPEEDLEADADAEADEDTVALEAEELPEDDAIEEPEDEEMAEDDEAVELTDEDAVLEALELALKSVGDNPSILIEVAGTNAVVPREISGLLSNPLGPPGERDVSSVSNTTMSVRPTGNINAVLPITMPSKTQSALSTMLKITASHYHHVQQSPIQHSLLSIADSHISEEPLHSCGDRKKGFGIRYQTFSRLRSQQDTKRATHQGKYLVQDHRQQIAGVGPHLQSCSVFCGSKSVGRERT